MDKYANCKNSKKLHFYSLCDFFFIIHKYIDYHTKIKNQFLIFNF